MTELFEALAAVIDDPESDEDQVVNLLASLPGQFNTLVTALEVNMYRRWKLSQRDCCTRNKK